MQKLRFLVIFVFGLFSLCFAEESITITTYYPSPYGSYKNLNIYNQDESTTQTDFTQGLTKAGLLITTDLTDAAFTPGVFWSTTNNNPTLPKAGIYLKESTADGTSMYFGTSNNYGTGITNNALVIDPTGKVGIGTTGPRQTLELAVPNSSTVVPVTSLVIGGKNQGKNVGALGSEMIRNQILFSAWRDVVTDSVGAKIVMIGYTNASNNLANKTDLVFFTGDLNYASGDNTVEAMRLKAGGNVGIGTTDTTALSQQRLFVAKDVTYPSDVTNSQLSVGGASDARKELAIGYDTNGNGFGFLAAGFRGVTWTNLALQPTGGNVGIGTVSPGEKLEVNGNIKFTADGSIMSKAPRVIHTEDPVSGCPPARAANVDLFTQTFTLVRTASVYINASIIRNYSGRADMYLYVDGIWRDQTLDYTPSAQWFDDNVHWAGTLAAGSHTVSLRGNIANIWGCGPTWGSIDTIIFE